MDFIQKYLNHPLVLSFRKGIRTFNESKNGQLLGKVFRYTFQAGIFAYLIYQLTQIGWLNVLKALPTNPLFYILLLLHYFTLPVSEQFIYRLSLKFGFWEGVKVFSKKKILNADVYAYTGEAYFYLWGKKNLEEDNRHIFNVIKDNNIISSIASTFMVAVLFVIVLYVAQENILDVISISRNTIIYIVVGAILALPLIVFLLRYVISMSARVAAKVFVIHLLRVIITYGLEVLQWIVVIPSVPLHVWFAYLAPKMIASRLPLPSQDILFISLTIMVSDYLDMESAAVAGLMAAVAAMNKLIAFLFYSFVAAFGEDRVLMEAKENHSEEE